MTDNEKPKCKCANCGCTDCTCTEQQKIGDLREPRTALPHVEEDVYDIQGPEVGHRPSGQTTHS